MSYNDTRHPAFIQVKTALLLHVPFFASLLLDIMKVKVGDFSDHPAFAHQKPTMATDGKTIFIDEAFLTSLPIQSSVFVVCHEIAHAMWDHMHRGKTYLDCGFDGEEFNPLLWNVAADYVINDLLVKAKVGTMPSGEDGKAIGLIDPKYTCDTWTPEAVYRDIKQNGLPQSAKSQGVAKDGSGRPGDGHVLELNDISPAELKRAIQSAADTAKAVGKLPKELERFAEALLDPQVSWQELLRTTVVTATTRDTTSWARPHRRRLVSQGVYLARPSAYGCDRIVVAVDTSGSIGDRELEVFFSELADIIRTCRPEFIDLLGVDSRVASHEELPGDTDIAGNPPKVGGGGGTDFRPAFEWVVERGIVPDAFVYFTDLYGEGPAQDPGYPVIWCSTTKDREGTCGRTIYVDIPKSV